MGTVQLICPLCGTDVAGATEPSPGRCPGCDAPFAGGGSSAPEGVTLALAQWGIDLPAADVTRSLFETEALPAPAPTAAITSDRRDGFYLWWVFVRPAEAGVEGVLRGLISAS